MKLLIATVLLSARAGSAASTVRQVGRVWVWVTHVETKTSSFFTHSPWQTLGTARCQGSKHLILWLCINAGHRQVLAGGYGEAARPPALHTVPSKAPGFRKGAGPGPDRTEAVRETALSREFCEGGGVDAHSLFAEEELKVF